MEKIHITGTQKTLANLLVQLTQNKEAQGLYFWGHGWKPYPSSGLTSSHGDDIFSYSADGPKLAYKLGVGMIYACDSNSRKSALVSGTTGHIWKGFSGTLYPVGMTYKCWQILKLGDQGTTTK